MDTCHNNNGPFVIDRWQFNDYIHFIEERYKAVSVINDFISDEFTDSVFFPYSKYETQLVNLLTKCMYDEKGKWIEYFIYELNFGKKYYPGCVTMDGKNVKLYSAEDLYELLVENYNNMRNMIQ